jgi:RND family efflux transporter MFP subunit
LRFSQEAAQAALDAAHADAANAAAELRRYDALGRTSPAFLAAEYDKRLANMRATAARFTQAERQLELAGNQRAYGVLRADADGIVTALPVQVGQVVSSGQTVATVALTGELEVAVDVPENRVAAVHPGSRVAIKLWAYPDLALHGRVREVGALAQPATRTFAVKVTMLDPPPNAVALGITAILGFGTLGATVAPLPASALADSDGKPAVYVLDASGTAVLRPVAVGGYATDGSVLVTSGLQGGEKVITAGLPHLQPGMRVTAWPGPAR